MSVQISKANLKKAYFLQNIAYEGNFNIPTSIELIQYDKNQVTTKSIESDQLNTEIKDGMVSWFKITGFTDAAKIMKICKDFGIHRFDIKDLFSKLQVTKIVTYESVTFILMSGCFFKDKHVEVEQIAFILGNNFVISIQESDIPVFEEIVSAIKESLIQIREQGADYLLYILLNSVHTLYIETVSKIDDKLEAVEEGMTNPEWKDMDIMRFFRHRRKDFSLLRRSIMPFREEYINLLHNSNGIICKESIIYFNDFDDRLRSTLEELEMLNESISLLLDLYFNNNNLKMNAIMKRLTAVSTIFIPLTFMAGVWGMNFKFMPELDTPYGYIFAWTIFLIIAAIAVLFLKKKKWF